MNFTLLTSNGGTEEAVMNTNTTHTIDALQATVSQNTRDSSPADYACTRCGGFIVQDSCLDVFDETGEIDLVASRCIQCGDLIDPVISRNRMQKLEPAHPKPTKWSRKSSGLRRVRKITLVVL